MALGYCPEEGCERLVPIQPQEIKQAGGQERWWKPVDHARPDGTPCPNKKRI